MSTAQAFGSADWWALFSHFLAMSMLSIGGALSTTPEMHRFLVERHGWITDGDFSASIALASAAPGPNLLFVPVLGYTVAGLPGAFVALAGILLPSTTLALLASRWQHSRRDTRGMRAFVGGLAPVTMGLLMSAGTLLAMPVARAPAMWLLIGTTVLLSVRTKINPVWMIAVGALCGALGWV